MKLHLKYLKQMTAFGLAAWMITLVGAPAGAAPQ